MDTVIDTPDTLVRRDTSAGKHTLSLLKHIYVERGTKEDWIALSELHYKGHTLAAGSRFVRCVYECSGVREVIGIMVFANPMPLNKGRNDVFLHLRPNRGGRDTKMMNKQRMKWINQNLTWNNRTVLDTMYRSAGIAYRFKNLAYRLYCTEMKYRFVESNSSMGRFNPFSVKSGMQFTRPRPAAALDVGVAFFRANFFAHPCDQTAILSELESLPLPLQKSIGEKLREFYYRHSAMEKSGDKMHIGMTRVNKLPIAHVLKETIQIVFGATIYWTWGENPDAGRTLPKRLPLLAFDNQTFNEPLNLKKLSEEYRND